MHSLCQTSALWPSAMKLNSLRCMTVIPHHSSMQHLQSSCFHAFTDKLDHHFFMTRHACQSVHQFHQRCVAHPSDGAKGLSKSYVRYHSQLQLACQPCKPTYCRPLSSSTLQQTSAHRASDVGLAGCRTVVSTRCLSACTACHMLSVPHACQLQLLQLPFSAMLSC
jgi:hypothetical protein